MSGCSALFMSGPPPGDGPLPEGTCETSVVAPALDAGVSAFWVLPTVGLAVDGDSWDDSQSGWVGAPKEAGIAMFGLLAGAWGYSAYKGFTWTSECRRRQALSEEAIADHLRTLARSAQTPDDSP